MNEYFLSFCLITRGDGKWWWLTHPNNVIIEDLSMIYGERIIVVQFLNNFFALSRVLINFPGVIYRCIINNQHLVYLFNESLREKIWKLYFFHKIVTSTNSSGSKNPLGFEILTLWNNNLWERNCRENQTPRHYERHALLHFVASSLLFINIIFSRNVQVPIRNI